MLYPIELRALTRAGVRRAENVGPGSPRRQPASLSFRRMQHLPTLPCYPCPHQSACCAYGTTLSPQEARAIRAEHGADRVYRTRWGEWRTRIVKGRCSLLSNNACTIYNKPYYPAVCRGFPWFDAE